MINDLFTQMRALWLQYRTEVNNAYKRTLPLAEYVVDRWQKARELGFGEGASIHDSVHVYGDVAVGEHTWVGPFVILDGEGGLKIGSYCSISAGVQIYSHDSVEWAVSGGKLSYRYAETSIGNHCYIGPNTIISKGVKIGNKCIIGANSLVLTNIPDNSNAHGNPCRVVRDSNY